ncbi:MULTISPECIES: YfcE family phosphodiesterase [Leuconostoc]|nr:MULTISPECIES: metallophosphoesterase [Leuconostoc]
MTKFLIISDTHGDRDILVQIINHWRSKVDGIFYNGDSELSAQDDVFSDVYTVLGNMDYDPDFAETHTETVAGTTFFQTHGHLYQATVPGTWANLSLMDQAAQSRGAQVVLFGHTHLEGAVSYHHKLFINPGSISLPKGPRAMIGGTYAILAVEEKQYVVHFYNRAQQLLENLTVSVER